MIEQLAINGIIAGTTIAVLAVGFSISYTASRFFIFTFGASYTWAAYTVLFFADRMSVVVGAVVGIAVAAVLAVLLELCIYRTIRRRGDNGVTPMLASIGAYAVLQNLVSLAFGDETRSVQTWAVKEGLCIFGARVSVVQLLIAGISLTALAATWAGLKYTPFGRRLRAVANDPELAHIVGLRVEVCVAIAIAWGSGMAGLAGVLNCLDTGLVPTMGFQALLLGVVACVVGGVNDFKGAMLAGFLLGLIQHLSVWKLPIQWQDAIVFLILIVCLLVRPQGLFGAPLRKVSV